MTGPLAVLLPGNRLHLQHGPIDLIVEAHGEADEVTRAYEQAKHRFATVLEELVRELPRLRRPCPRQGLKLRGMIARRMERAVKVHAPQFITPMAAVAGSVADEVLGSLISGRRLVRAYVNNGGDIALFLAEGQSFNVGVASDPRFPDLSGTLKVDARDGIGGVATSGRGGRSFSLGVADAVTVAASSAAAADAAATMIANAVDLPGSPKVERVPARAVDPESDLGERPVTVGVGSLTAGEVGQALDSGEATARRLIAGKRILAAVLLLSGEARTTGLWEGVKLAPPKVEDAAYA